MFKEQNSKDADEEIAAAIGSRFKRASFLWVSDVHARNVPVSDERYCIADNTADLLIQHLLYPAYFYKTNMAGLKSHDCIYNWYIQLVHMTSTYN